MLSNFSLLLEATALIFKISSTFCWLEMHGEAQHIRLKCLPTITYVASYDNDALAN